MRGGVKRGSNTFVLLVKKSNSVTLAICLHDFFEKENFVLVGERRNCVFVYLYFK